MYLGFMFSFFSTWFAAMPVMAAAYTIGLLVRQEQGGAAFDRKWIGISFGAIAVLIFLRFLFDYFRARFQETISYELTARDRLAVGEALKRVSLGYFQQVSTGTILNSITTGLHSLENMGMRMVDSFVGGYLNFFCIFLWLFVISPAVSLIALVGAAVSFGFLLLVSRYSRKNAPVSAKAGQDLTAAVLEYARGLPVVKSFGQGGASMAAMKQACRDMRRICLRIEWGFIPSNCMHLMALKTASVFLAGAACFLCRRGELDFSRMLMFVFFSFSIFGHLESISDNAHVLGVIDTAMDQLEALQADCRIDRDGRSVELSHHTVEFRNVRFGYDERTVLHNVSFQVPEGTSTAIVGASGSGKTTICNLIARFYDVQAGEVRVGGHDVREFTCDSLLKNISMVFQNVYLFQDTIRSNIRFGRPDATDQEVEEAAKAARCHDFIRALPEGYDTVIGEGGGTLSGGERQRISIARAILKNAPIIILDEATASVDPENEHLIQEALSELTRGKTVITIAHRLATIEHADQILVIHEGRVAEAGTHAQLVKRKGIYRDFVKLREEAEGWRISREI